MIVTIDTDLIQLAKDEAGKITLTAEASKIIAQFQSLLDQMTEAREEIKDTVKAKMYLLDPTCTSVTGDGIKISLSPAGPRFAIDRLNIDKLPKDWYAIETKYTLDIKKVDEYVKTNNAFPLGIVEPVRGYSLRITTKNGTNEQTE